MHQSGMRSQKGRRTHRYDIQNAEQTVNTIPGHHVLHYRLSAILKYTHT